MSTVLFFFEFGYVLQHLAVIFQILQINRKRSTEGVAIETIYFFIIATVCRLIWMWDSMLSKYTLAYFEVVVAVGCLVYIVYIYNKYKESDYIKQNVRMPVFLSFPVLLGSILILSFLFHPGTKNNYYLTIQMLVSMNIYSECIGLLPQLYLIKKSSDTGNISVYYLVFLGVARFFRLFFWFKMYMDGNSFISLIIADLLHTILLTLFVLLYTKNKDSIKLPTFATGDDSRKKIF